MNNFRSLEHLTMEGKSGICWPTSKTNKSVMLSFMEYIQECNYYSIKLGGVTGETWLMDLFYDSLEDSEEDGRPKTYFYIVFGKSEEGHSYTLKGNFELHIEQQNEGLDASLHLYEVNDDVGDVESKVKDRLAKPHSSTEGLYFCTGL